MKVELMREEDARWVIPLYLDYYNNCEGGCWTEASAGKRIRQVLRMDDSYCVMLKADSGEVCGFAMGYFKQYDDIVGYTLEEIVIAREYQHKGLGSQLLKELESMVRQMGAACVELQAVKDELHEGFYGKAGYRDARNFVMKVKWFS